MEPLTGPGRIADVECGVGIGGTTTDPISRAITAGEGKRRRAAKVKP